MKDTSKSKNQKNNKTDLIRIFNTDSLRYTIALPLYLIFLLLLWHWNYEFIFWVFLALILIDFISNIIRMNIRERKLLK